MEKLGLVAADFNPPAALGKLAAKVDELVDHINAIEQKQLSTLGRAVSIADFQAFQAGTITLQQLKDKSFTTQIPV